MTRRESRLISVGVPVGSTTIGVCGFGRCGATMVMRMLDAGGVHPTAGPSVADYEAPDGADGLSALLRESREVLAGHTVKLLDHPGELPDSLDWRFIWIDRDVPQQSLSIMKAMAQVGALGESMSRGSAHLQFRQLTREMPSRRPQALHTLRGLGPVAVVQFERILARPMKALRQFSAFLPPDFDWAAAAAVVDTARDARCAPDMAREALDRAAATAGPLLSR